MYLKTLGTSKVSPCTGKRPRVLSATATHSSCIRRVKGLLYAVLVYYISVRFLLKLLQVKEDDGDEGDEPDEGDGEKTSQAPKPRQAGRGKRKAEEAEFVDTERPRRSTRARK